MVLRARHSQARCLGLPRITRTWDAVVTLQRVYRGHRGRKIYRKRLLVCPCPVPRLTPCSVPRFCPVQRPPNRLRLPPADSRRCRDARTETALAQRDVPCATLLAHRPTACPTRATRATSSTRDWPMPRRRRHTHPQHAPPPSAERPLLVLHWGVQWGRICKLLSGRVVARGVTPPRLGGLCAPMQPFWISQPEVNVE